MALVRLLPIALVLIVAISPAWPQPSAGGAPATLPGQESFWVAQASGTGQQELLWVPAAGDWTAVVMNADGSRPVVAYLSFGATAPGLSAIWPALLIARRAFCH